MTTYLSNVYFDDNIKMYRMMADTEKELVTMKNKLDIEEKYHVNSNSVMSCLLVCESKRDGALSMGSVILTDYEMDQIIIDRIKTGSYD